MNGNTTFETVIHTDRDVRMGGTWLKWLDKNVAFVMYLCTYKWVGNLTNPEHTLNRHNQTTPTFTDELAKVLPFLSFDEHMTFTSFGFVCHLTFVCFTVQYSTGSS